MPGGRKRSPTAAILEDMSLSMYNDSSSFRAAQDTMKRQLERENELIAEMEL